MDRNKLLFIQIQPLPPSMHRKWKEVIDLVCKTTNGNHRQPTPKEERSIKLKDDSIMPWGAIIPVQESPHLPETQKTPLVVLAKVVYPKTTTPPKTNTPKCCIISALILRMFTTLT